MTTLPYPGADRQARPPRQPRAPRRLCDCGAALLFVAGEAPVCPTCTRWTLDAADTAEAPTLLPFPAADTIARPA